MNDTSPTSISQEKSLANEDHRLPNAYLVKNSRFIKKELRDPRLFLSPTCNDFLVLKTDKDLAELLGTEYVLVEVFDSLGEASPKTRELTTLKIIKTEILAGKMKELLAIWGGSNLPLEEAKYAKEKEVRDLFEQCGLLKTQLQEIEEQIQHIGKMESEKKSGLLQTVPKRLITLTHAQVLQRTIPPREFILTPWLPEAGIAMIFSPPGIGKTNFCLSVAYAVASGSEMLWWKAPKARRVFYLDAEMHESDLQSRIRKIEAGFSKKISDPEYFRYLNGSWQPREVGIPDLATIEGQKLIEEQIGDATFVVIDNLSTVCRTGNENESRAWNTMQNWLLSLRWRGITILLVHHAGKSTDAGGIPVQRGSSMREVILEASLALKRPKNYSADQGCIFEGHFLKARGFSGVEAEPFQMKLEEKNDAFWWTGQKLCKRNYDLVIDLFNDGIVNPREIAEELGITRQAVQKHIKKAKRDGDIR